jgi:hypothetical protein
VVVNNAEILLKTPAMAAEAPLLSGINLTAHLQRGAGGSELVLEPGRILSDVQISRTVCEGGLKFALPVLAAVTWVQGEMSLDLEQCHIDLANAKKTRIAGQIRIHEVKAGLKDQLARQITQTVARLAGHQGALGMHLAKDSSVDFRVREGRVWHEGLAFGLPDVSPDLQIRSRGSVGFDESLDLMVDIPLPLDLLVDGPLARKVGAQTLNLPVQGTLSEPKVRIPAESVLASLIGASTDGGAERGLSLDEILAPLRGLRRARAESESPPLLDRIRERRSAQQEAGDRREPRRGLRGLLNRVLEEAAGQAGLADPPTNRSPAGSSAGPDP